MHVGYSTNPDPAVLTHDVRAAADLAPTDASGVLDNLVQTMRRGTGPSTYHSEGRVIGPSMYADQRYVISRPWDDCLSSAESLLGEERSRTTFTVAKDTDSGQRGATVVYRSSDAVPAAIANGMCGLEGFDRYDLPTSGHGVTWTLVGPVTHRYSLMTRALVGGELDLVKVTAEGRRVVGMVPAGSQVVAPGTTGGFFG